MKLIRINKEHYSKIDDSDFVRVNAHKWNIHKSHSKNTCKLYAVAEDNKMRMHRFILNVPKGLCVDHINGDGLDNRRKNIRICTVLENNRNRHIVRSKTGFKGIYFDKSGKRKRRFVARIRMNNRMHHIGRFMTAIAAAKAYDKAARKMFGEFARPNFQKFQFALSRV